jgi:hypothetical protein
MIGCISHYNGLYQTCVCVCPDYCPLITPTPELISHQNVEGESGRLEVLSKLVYHHSSLAVIKMQISCLVGSLMYPFVGWGWGREATAD